MNWGYLSSIFCSLNISTFVKDHLLKNRLPRNSVKFFLSFVALLYFGFALKKIYEVPVYVTKIDALASDVEFDKDRGITISILRNYDRNDKGTVRRDSVWYQWNSKSQFSGGVGIDGYGKATQGISIGDEKRIAMVRDTLKHVYSKYNRTPIKARRIVYLSIQTTKRQSLQPPSPRKYIEHIDSCKDCLLYTTFFNGYEAINDSIKYKDYFEYERKGMEEGYNSAICENIIAVSKEDSTISIHAGFSTTAFGSPNILVAEDISKFVEVIYVGDKKMNPDSLSLWSAVNNLIFDYSGPADFSNHIVPEPDEITLSSIRYTDSLKIQEIGRNGLRFHVNLPDMENKQESRIFILSAIVTALGALVLRYFWRIMNDLLKKLSNALQNRNILRVFIEVIILAGILWLIAQISIGVYYSNVNPFSMFNPLVD